MTDTGYFQLAQNGYEDSIRGIKSWSDTGNVTASDNSYASVSLGFSTAKVLVGNDFGLNVPSGATILGIEAAVEMKSTYIINSMVCQLFVGVSATETRGFSSSSSTKQTYILGSSTDLWGNAFSWTPTLVNDIDFGIGIRNTNNALGSLYVDSISVKVYYELPPLTKTINDTVSLTDDNSKIFGYSKTIADTTSLTDNFSRIATFKRNVADTVSLTDNQSKVSETHRTITDTVSLADSISRIVTYERVIDDTISTVDNIEQLKGSYRDFDESMIITDNIIVSANYIRTIADTISMSESISARKQSADVWKSIVAMKINIGGQWTDLF